MAWAEDPPSRTRHLIANIEIEPGDADAELKVYSNFIIYRSRAETEQDFFVGARQDVLRLTSGNRRGGARSRRGCRVLVHEKRELYWSERDRYVAAAPDFWTAG